MRPQPQGASGCIFNKQPPDPPRPPSRLCPLLAPGPTLFPRFRCPRGGVPWGGASRSSGPSKPHPCQPSRDRPPGCRCHIHPRTRAIRRRTALNLSSLRSPLPAPRVGGTHQSQCPWPLSADTHNVTLLSFLCPLPPTHKPTARGEASQPEPAPPAHGPASDGDRQLLSYPSLAPGPGQRKCRALCSVSLLPPPHQGPGHPGPGNRCSNLLSWD